MRENRAFAAIYAQYHCRVQMAVGRLAPDPDTAEDWAQESWIRVYNGLSSFRGGSDLGTWIYQVAFRTALSMRRTEVRRFRLRETWRRTQVEVSDSGTTAVMADFENALETLPLSMQAILRLHVFKGMRHREIAATLRVTESTSRSQLFEARRRLRFALTGLQVLRGESTKRAPASHLTD